MLLCNYPAEGSSVERPAPSMSVGGVCLCLRMKLLQGLSTFEDICISLLLTVTHGNISIRPA